MSSGIFYQNNISPGDLASAANTGAAGAIAATILGIPGRQVMVTGLSVTGTGATGATVVNAITTGMITNLAWVIAVPAGVSTGITPIQATFWPPIAGVVGSNVTITVPTFGAGNTNVAAAIWGFYQ